MTPYQVFGEVVPAFEPFRTEMTTILLRFRFVFILNVMFERHFGFTSVIKHNKNLKEVMDKFYLKIISKNLTSVTSFIDHLLIVVFVCPDILRIKNPSTA